MEHLEVIRTYVDLWNSRTFAEHAHTILDADAVLLAGTGQEFQGRDDYIAAAVGFFELMPDAHAELADHEVSGDRVDVTFNFTGTFTGEMTTPDGKVIPGNGNRAEWQSFVTFEFKDGKIARAEVTVDMEDFMRQLDLS